MGTWASGRRWDLHPEGREQRCWNQKLLNVLDALPKSDQPVAKELLRDMHFAQSRAECEKKRDQFKARYKKYQQKAVETLERDWDRMTTFFDFPKEHWCICGPPISSSLRSLRFDCEPTRPDDINVSRTRQG